VPKPAVGNANAKSSECPRQRRARCVAGPRIARTMRATPSIAAATTLAGAVDQGRYNEPSVYAPAGESEAPKDQHRKEQHHSEVQEDIEGQRWMLTRRAAPGDRFQAMRPHCRGDDCNFETVVDNGCWRGGRLVDRPINWPVTTPRRLRFRSLEGPARDPRRQRPPATLHG
jgi:hypothetical protein